MKRADLRQLQPPRVVNIGVVTVALDFYLPSLLLKAPDDYTSFDH